MAQDTIDGWDAPLDDWSGATALVTGAASGIGKEVARQLAEAGLNVWAADRDERGLSDAVAEFGPNATALPMDISDALSVSQAAGWVTTLDLLVNDAGVGWSSQTLLNEDVDVFRTTYDTNVFGTLIVTQALVPVMRASSRPRIVNIGSGTGSLTMSTDPNASFNFKLPGSGAAYRTSKTAVHAITVFTAQELESDGFRVNASNPSLRSTNISAGAHANGGDPAEAARGAVHLALMSDPPNATLVQWDGQLLPW